MKRNEESYAKVKSKEMFNYRNQMGVSQVAMAKKLGLSHRMWNHYEHGTRQVPISVVLSAKYLCKNLDKMDKLHDDIKQHEEPLTKWDVDRIEALMKAAKTKGHNSNDNDPSIARIFTQCEKEMGFLLSKIN
jgi:predicted transcriptional regulator